MPDFSLLSRSALAGKTSLETPDISLKPLPEGHVIHVLARPGADISAISRHFSNAAHAPRKAAPGQWFIVGDVPLTPDELRALFERLAPDAAGVDQSHGRIRILVSGPKVERVLAKGTGVDLAPAAFPVGHATTMLLGHIAAHMTRVSEDAFELMVLRGFAESLWDELLRMATGLD
jgi:sarcosine oxidase subunit gamma